MAGSDDGFDLGQRLALAALLDRALNKGVVIWGDATISVAGVDLIYVGLKVLAASVDTARKLVPEPLDQQPSLGVGGTGLASGCTDTARSE